METITKIFTTEDQQELKNSFKEIICEQFKLQLDEMDLYLFDLDTIEDLIQNAFKEIISEIKIEFKEKLREQIFKLLETNDIEKLIGLKSQLTSYPKG